MVDRCHRGARRRWRGACLFCPSPVWWRSSPVEFELPGDEAVMHRDGDRLVIEPVRKRGLVALLKTMKPLEEGFPEIDDPTRAPERVFWRATKITASDPPSTWWPGER
jgi:antitoxin VapB